MYLETLFHWSPTDRRASIRRRGLVPGSRAQISTVSCVGMPGHDSEDEPPVHVICLGFDPLAAWALSGDMHWARDVPSWDLWAVYLASSDEVGVLPTYGPRMREVRVANRIPKSRVTYVASRPGGRTRW